MISRSKSDPGPAVQSLHLPWRYRLTHQPIQGLSCSTLKSLLRRSQPKVDGAHRDRLAFLTATSFLHSALEAREGRLFAEQAAATQLQAPPVFVLGHWRNGTTFLHSLLCQDHNHTFPRMFHSLLPGSFLLPRLSNVFPLIERLLSLETRPMDQVKMGLQEPWEDEFLMMGLTGLSPYARILFPRSLGREIGFHYPDIESEQEIKRWQNTFSRLLKRLTLFQNKRIVLKSPPHTGRIKILLQLYPDAKFIHIARHPYSVFPSNLKMWRTAFAWSFLQDVPLEDIVEIIFTTYIQLYERYWAEQDLIPAGNLAEVKFEDLEVKPMATLASIYECLQLPGFDDLAPRARIYLDGLRHYRKNVFELDNDLKEIIDARWAMAFDAFGYDVK